MSAGVAQLPEIMKTAPLLEQFPDAVDLVLVHSERWTEYHTTIREALTESVAGT